MRWTWLAFAVASCGGNEAPMTASDAREVDSTITPDAAPCKQPPYTSYTVSAARGGASAVLVHSSYDYAPTVMLDNGTYRMWWCGGVAGDYVLHAEASMLVGPWHAHGSSTANTYDVALQPTGNTADFDGTHTCDPSVIRVDGTYYLFYGGLAKPEATSPTNVTAIGLATSTDGVTFTRAHGGKPIITAAADLTGKPNAYGAGQPSVIVQNGSFYLLYTDTSAPGSNTSNGAGAYVLRSTDPTFQVGVEELGAGGFAPVTSNTHGQYPLLQAFSLDWMSVPSLGLIIVGQSSSPAPDFQPRQVNLHMFRADALPATEGPDSGVVAVEATWSEGVGLVANPDRTSIGTSASCATLAVDLVRSVGTSGAPSTWDLAWAGWNLTVL